MKAQLSQHIQLEEIAQKYGTGLTTGHIVDEIIDNTLDFQKEAEVSSMQAVRARITDHIRAANPASSAFSEQYRTAYENAKEATIKALQPVIHAEYTSFASTIGDMTLKYREMSGRVDQLIRSARENVPVGAGEFTQLIQTRLKIDNALIDNTERMISIYQKIETLLTGKSA